ncbi:unnamed protein product [Allacma fusca]|uniref:Pre-mRNA-splicing factor Syf1/CRNKL1-like C-terminal HAT-repeats domain-containing protein n=1 Tax=Allacma fusca TaxID=39272 RepID=A0A8J2PJY6_9HEXA|nr:unnamed protein product [Allacma fusca]
MKFAELECLLGDLDRARAIYELAVTQPRLDMPEILWKTYIDFEVELGETDRARELYYRLLERTQHVKVWLSLSQFELSIADENSTTKARRVFEKANEQLRNQDKEERLMLLEGWKVFEIEHGDEESINKVNQKMPKRIKKRRKVETADGTEAGWEEYFDYIFPEDESARPNLKLLAMAKMWKKKKEDETEVSKDAEDDE